MRRGILLAVAVALLPFVASQGFTFGNVDRNGVLLNEYINAITAYGPGLGVFTPWTYVDISYDNIPFVGKVPLIGKEGTSSGLGIANNYPPTGNPGNPIPPLYRARPLPPNIPEPVDVVAVPLDEEALHGEPLFPKELTLPGMTTHDINDMDEEQNKVDDPFGDLGDGKDEKDKNGITDEDDDDVTLDSVHEKNVKAEDMVKKEEVPAMPRSPFRKRTKRFAGLAHILGMH